jgi:hypothetical protein
MPDIESDIEREVKAKAIAGVVTGGSACVRVLRSTIGVRVAGGFRVARGRSGCAGCVLGHGYSPDYDAKNAVKSAATFADDTSAGSAASNLSYPTDVPISI